jgi:hypothetical protein
MSWKLPLDASVGEELTVIAESGSKSRIESTVALGLLQPAVRPRSSMIVVLCSGRHLRILVACVGPCERASASIGRPTTETAVPRVAPGNAKSSRATPHWPGRWKSGSWNKTSQTRPVCCLETEKTKIAPADCCSSPARRTPLERHFGMWKSIRT